MSKFKVGDTVYGQKQGYIGMVTNIDASSEYCHVDGKAWYHFDDLELVELAQPENPHMITYTMTVPKDMYPFKPYSKVVYKKNSNNKENVIHLLPTATCLVQLIPQTLLRAKSVEKLNLIVYVIKTNL